MKKEGEESRGRGPVLWKLLLSTLYISAFTFGGGFVIVTFMKRKFVDELHWIDNDEMLDLAALAQSSPGAIAVNAAILVGWRVAGLAGMVTAVLATILPPMLILSIVSLFYEAFASNYFIQLVLRGMQAGVAAVILDVTFGLGRGVLKERSVLNCLVMAGVFGASFFFGVNVVVLILASGAVGIIREVFRHRKAESAGSGDCQG